MEPLDEVSYRNERHRLKTLLRSLDISDPSRGRIVEVGFDNIIDLLIQHQGPEDVRINTWNRRDDIEGLVLNIDDILYHLYAEEKVFQYVIDWTPEWLRKMRGDNLPDPPEGWISTEQVSEAKGVSVRTIREYCRKGYLTSEKCKGGIWYVNPDAKLDYWIRGDHDYGALYQRLLLASDILEVSEPESVDALYDEIARMEEELSAPIRGKNIPVKTFFQTLLKKQTPKTIDRWMVVIQPLLAAARIKLLEQYGKV